MDMRKWFLLQDRPAHDEAWFREAVKHTPCSLDRGPKALQLFITGFHTGFMLTDHDGQPTLALELMAKLMGVELILQSDLPDNELKPFVGDKKALINTLTRTWCLRGLTGRIKSAFSVLQSWTHEWVWEFLPGLASSYVWYKDPDGKRRKRVCYIAKCPPNWEMTDYVYGGLHKWTYDHHGPEPDHQRWSPAPWPDAYTLLREHPAFRPCGDSRRGCRPGQALCSTSAQGIPESGGGVQPGLPDGADTPPVDCAAAGGLKRVTAALLLRDIWEVLQETARSRGERVPVERRTTHALVSDLMNTTFAGEGVLF